MGVLVAQRFGRRTFDQTVVGSIPGRGVVDAPRLTQPSIPSGYVNRAPASLVRVKAGVLAYVGLRVKLCE